MRSKVPLAMMEQMVMLLVFALAAALCLQVFVHSDRLSRQGEERDRAAVLCQNAAEVLRAAGGNFIAAADLTDATGWNNVSFRVCYDGDWNRTEGDDRFVLEARRIRCDVPGLGKAYVRVRDGASGKELFHIETAWQEVSG